jgi:hypothetical protein
VPASRHEGFCCVERGSIFVLERGVTFVIVVIVKNLEHRLVVEGIPGAVTQAARTALRVEFLDRAVDVD